MKKQKVTTTVNLELQKNESIVKAKIQGKKVSILTNMNKIYVYEEENEQ